MNGARAASGLALVALLVGPAQADTHRVYLRGGVVHVMPLSSSS